MNRKLILRIAGAILLVILILFIMNLASCGVASDQKAYLRPLVGTWYCDEFALDHPDLYTGYLGLWIPSNGRFAMYDKEAGNPGIAGRFSSLTETELHLSCTDADFTPPAGWENMDKEQIIQYELISDRELHLTYSDKNASSTLVFRR